MEKGRVSASDVNRLLIRLGIDPQEAKFLRTLNLSYKHLTDEEIYILTICADSARVLDTLKLSSNNIGDEGAIAISKFLLRNRTITCLDMGFNSIGDQGVAALSESLTVNNSLQTLYLSGNKISVTGFENLAKALASNTSLRFVYLTGNDAKAAGAEALASAITSSFSLETLDLGRNEIGPDGMASLTRSLKRCGPECRLKKLNISNNNLGDLGVIALGDAMSSYRNIVHLDVSFNNISQSGAVSLMAALRGYKALRSLFLDNNLIGDRGAKALAQSLSSMNISSLNIGFNNISAEGLSYILVDIFNAKCISSLALSGNILSPEVVKRISAYIRNDTMLRELYLDQMKMDRDSEKNIALGISLNENLVLSVFTGFALGPVLGELRNNETLISLSNDQVLKFLCQTRIEVKDTDPGMSQNQSCSNFLAAVAHVLPPENFKDNGTLSGFPSTNSFILSEEEISLLLSDADPFANSVRTNVTSVNSKNDATPIHIEDASLWRELQKIANMDNFNLQELQLLDGFYCEKFPTMKKKSDDELNVSFKEADGSIKKRTIEFEDNPDANGGSFSKRSSSESSNSRISIYRRIQSKIEELKLQGLDKEVLTLLRQLRFLEQYLNSNSSTIMSVTEIENIILAFFL